MARLNETAAAVSAGKADGQDRRAVQEPIGAHGYAPDGASAAAPAKKPA